MAALLGVWNYRCHLQKAREPQAKVLEGKGLKLRLKAAGVWWEAVAVDIR